MASGAPPKRKKKEGGKRGEEEKRRKRGEGEKKRGETKKEEKGRNKEKKKWGKREGLGGVYNPPGHQGTYQSPQLDKAGKPQTDESAPQGKDKSPKHMYTIVHNAIKRK